MLSELCSLEFYEVDLELPFKTNNYVTKAVREEQNHAPMFKTLIPSVLVRCLERSLYFVFYCVFKKWMEKHLPTEFLLNGCLESTFLTNSFWFDNWYVYIQRAELMLLNGKSTSCLELVFLKIFSLLCQSTTFPHSNHVW